MVKGGRAQQLELRAHGGAVAGKGSAADPPSPVGVPVVRVANEARANGLGLLLERDDLGGLCVGEGSERALPRVSVCTREISEASAEFGLKRLFGGTVHGDPLRFRRREVALVEPRAQRGIEGLIDMFGETRWSRSSEAKAFEEVEGCAQARRVGREEDPAEPARIRGRCEPRSPFAAAARTAPGFSSSQRGRGVGQSTGECERKGEPAEHSRCNQRTERKGEHAQGRGFPGHPANVVSVRLGCNPGSEAVRPDFCTSVVWRKGFSRYGGTP